MQSNALHSRPRAETVPVEYLVTWVNEGRIRIPNFQRPFRWSAKDVWDLFDSLWLGYPVGSVVFWQRPSESAEIKVGPLQIDAPGRPDALWVVDGQQRLTALSGVLLHPHPTISRSDIFALWFNLKEEVFTRPAPGEDIPAHWIPMNKVLDAVHLGEWWSENQELSGQSDLYRVALKLGKRIRESKLPIYIVDTDDSDALKVIFARLNTSGVPMRETEVFSALHTVDGVRPPLKILADVCREARMGVLKDEWLLRCLRIVAGELLDSGESQRELDVYRTYVDPSVAALGAALDFLRNEGHIPHLRLMPYRLPVVALTRFFQLHPDPTARTRILLRRWLWRGIVNQRHKDTGNPQLRWLSQAIDADEHESMQRLLRNVGVTGESEISSFTDQAARTVRNFAAAEAKVFATLLAYAGPRHLDTGELLDVAQLLEEFGPHALMKVAKGRQDSILHPYNDDPAAALDSASEEIKRSHHWTLSGAGEEARRAQMSLAFRDLVLTWCEPGMPDLPPFEALFSDLGEE